ncbi:MAG: MDR family MFS transporter [Anaerolineales bacterium]
MFIEKQQQKLISIYREYPRSFWTLVMVTFIDRVGGAMLYPFFALYLTRKFGVGMTEVGVLFAVFSLSGFISNTIGGALTDRLGRKGILIFGLIASSFSAVAMGLVNSFEAFFVLALTVGILSDVAGPAHNAMVADLLPEEQRAQGYGIIRVAFNLSVTIGPAIGGLLASRSYLALFIADAIISLITAVLVWRYLPETKPQAQKDAPQVSMAGTFVGYFRVLRDLPFLLFMGACILMTLVYINMNTTLGVYLRDVHGVAESGYGYILSLNAVMVVLFQFGITRRIEKRPPLLMMAIGTALYAIGFAMYGFVSAYIMFLLAMVIITLGEMIVAPVGQALVAKFAPEDMRGRYMAVFGYSWGIPFAIGPYLAGIVLDNYDPHVLWYAAGIVGTLAVMGFLGLYRNGEAKQDTAQPATIQPV